MWAMSTDDKHFEKNQEALVKYMNWNEITEYWE